MLKQSVVFTILATTFVSAVATAQSSGRSDYGVVDVKNFVAQNQILNSNPNQVAVNTIFM